MVEEINNDMDAFLDLDNEQEDFFSVTEETQDKPSTEHEKEQEEKGSQDPNFLKELDIGLPRLVGDGYSPDFLSMVERVYDTYKILPNLEYDKLYRELADLSITSSPTPTLQILNDEIQKVQASKDRLSEIMVKVLECHNIKKRLVDILVTAWGKFSLEKNAEGRKGDGLFRLSDFSIDFAKVESLLKVCTHVLKNLDSFHDSLSRRITINQLLLKMNDMGRGALPDHTYTGKGDIGVGEADLFGESKNIDPSESIDAAEESW